MANGGFLTGNLAGLATPVCAYANSDYPAANLIDKVPSVAYRSSGGTALPRWNFGAAKAITGFSLHNHNIPDDAVIKLQFSSNNWLSVAEEVTLTWAAGHLFKAFTLGGSYQYAGFSCTPGGGIPVYIEIGEIFWGTAWPFANRNFNWEFRNIKRVFRDMRVNKGQAFVDVRAQQRGYALEFTAISDSDRALFDALIEQEKVVFIPDFDVNVPLFGTLGESGILDLDGVVSYPGQKLSLRFWADYKGAA